jgi:hypothetical protein
MDLNNGTTALYNFPQHFQRDSISSRLDEVKSEGQGHFEGRQAMRRMEEHRKVTRLYETTRRLARGARAVSEVA